MMKRILAVLLCLLCVISVLSACKSTETPPADTAAIDTSDDGADEEEKVVLPENMNYKGEDFYFLTAGNVAYHDFDVEEDTAGLNAVTEAQYKRLKYFEDKYGVKIIADRKQDNWSYGAGPGYKTVQTQVQSETLSYHLCLIGGYDAAALARDNYLYDLNSMEWIDTSKSWWDQNANTDLAIKGLLFFTNSELTGAYSETTFSMLFNKQLAKSHLGDIDVYQLVKDNQWTVDKLGELSRRVSEDLDGNSIINYKDRFGIYTWDDSMIGMVEAAGSKICTIDENGDVTLSLNNDKTVNMINKYAAYAYDASYALPFQAVQREGLMTGADVYASFAENKALFWAGATGDIPFVRNMESDFGILPYPMLTEDQGRYYSTMAPYNSQFICIPLFIDNEMDYIGSVTEALAYHGQQTLTPAVYEKTLKGLYSRDEESYDMLDIIFGSYCYDFGLYYRIGMYPDMLLNLLRYKSTDFASGFQDSSKAAEYELTVLNQYFDELVEYWEEEKAD